MTLNESAPSSLEDRPKPRYWRSLSELNQRDDFQEYLDREFPVAASEFPEGVSRRRWIQLMGASFALAGIAGCRYPEELITPFVIRPEGRMPGETYLRATNVELAGRVYHLLVSCFDGRPLKIEPNTEHPSGGGTDVFAQASILGLYDPDRARGDEGFLIENDGKRRREVSWEKFEPYGKARVKEAEGNNSGGSFAVLMSPTQSPSTLRLLSSLKKRLPNATFCQYDGVGDGVMRQATSEVFGKPAKQLLQLDEADVIITLQADILGGASGMLDNAASFAKNREPDAETAEMSRLYVVEGGFSSTGAMADSRLALRPSQMKAFLSDLARRVDALAANEAHSHVDPEKAFDELDADERLEAFLDAAAHDIHAHGEKAVVVVGEHLGAEAVAAGIRFNKKIGSYGTLQTFVPELESEIGDTVTLKELVAKIDDGGVDTLLVLGDNPVFAAPSDIDVQSAIGKVADSIYLGEYDDETAVVCKWSLPLSHPLESWGDTVDDRGVYGVCQPQILPLLGGRSTAEVVAQMLGEEETDGQQIVRRTADVIAGKSLKQREWRALLQKGYAEGLGGPVESLQPSGEFAPLTDESPTAIVEIDGETMKNDFEVLFMPADGLYDGRFANNGWLQEMPQSLTKLSWDNAAVMSPATAKSLDIRHGLKVTLKRTVEGGEVSLVLPVYEMPGCAPGVVTATIGYGRTRAGMVGGWVDKDVDVVGIDVSPIRTSDAMLLATGVVARPKFVECELATTQDHWAIDELGREETSRRSVSLIREGTAELMKKVPEFAEVRGPHVPKVGRSGSPWHEPINMIQEENERNESLVPQWGMSIDLTKCTGCNACVIACQSENNVPIVGREQVMNSREMHWLRIDRYFQGDEDNAEVVQQPMACQHCETAPCEQVCPVAATVHTNEGINAMVYNRCIGTRYCANNCPFKVRRFNYFNYNEDVGVGYGIDAYPGTIEKASRKLQALVLNPDVTVRGRGVMEKCTYCVQRVEKAKIEARKDGGRAIRDGDVITACQSACPTRAIEFGNIADPESAVSQKHQDPRSYGMLGQLNVKPRTEYLAQVRNPPRSLMSRAQLDDLANMHAPHHGHDEEHGHEDAHGHSEEGHEPHEGHGSEESHGDE